MAPEMVVATDHRPNPPIRAASVSPPSQSGARAKGAKLSFFQHQEHVTFLKGCGAVGDDDDAAPRALDPSDGGVQRHRAVIVEVGVRLVQPQHPPATRYTAG